MPSPVDALTQLAFKVHGNPGVFALLIGSGLSRAAGIPSGWDITLDLVRLVAIAQGEKDHPRDWAAWHKAKFGTEPSYSELIALLGSTPHERRAILNSYIEPTDEDLQRGRKIPTKAHHAIAELVQQGMVRVVITTNFDRLLEDALREHGTEPTVVDSVHAIEGAEPLTHVKCYVVKLHGDYKDVRILNTVDELSRYPSEVNDLLARIFDDHGLVVCGWSGEWDVALYDAIMRSSSRRYSMYWAARGPLGDAAQRIVAHHRAHQVRIADADNFFGALRDQVQTLTQIRRQDPDNIELLVGTAKQLAANRDRRIELHDLIESEVQKCIHSLREAAPTEAAELVAWQESATESLGRMLGVLGRWGNGAEHESAVNGLVAMWLHADESDAAIPHLRNFPTVLLLWAYGFGLTIGRRWRELHSLLSHSVSSGFGGPPRAFVYVVSEWLLEGYRNEIWKRLHGGVRTPGSNHQHAVLARWRDSFAAILPDFDDEYDTWEILFALTYRDFVPSERDGMRFWAPIGRNAWRRQSRHRILERIVNGDLRADLIAGGLAGGSGDRLADTVQAYAEFVEGRRQH